MEGIDQQSQQPGQHAAALVRSRSNTAASSKTRRRPLSRASTTSIQSANTAASQPTDHRQYGGYQPHPQAQSTAAMHNQLQRADSYEYSPEGMILQSAQHLTNPETFQFDPSLISGNSQSHPYQDSRAFTPQMTQSRPGTAHSGYDTTMHPSVEFSREQLQDTPEPETEMPDGPKGQKKNSATAQNDLELRRLFRYSEHMSLKDIGLQLQGNERGPTSEKLRQTFAMVWLNASCSRSTGSVPRGRVYHNYVQRCGEERLTMLNPASFGKLVRVMFPNIQTRRLGMRGESKYHYCGLTLNDDQQGSEESKAKPGRGSKSLRPNDTRTKPESIFSLPPDTADFPAPEKSSSSTKSQVTENLSTSRLFYDSYSSKFDINSDNNSIERELRFSSKPDVRFSDKETIDLPDIQAFVPEGTDRDTSDALMALYRTHCTSLIDCIRFCREQPFFHFFSSFHGTLTVPVQKLLAQPSVATWIMECDWMMYQKMIRVVAPLTLQVVPQGVMNFLRAISQRLAAHVKSSFASHPECVIKARLGPATIFASLLDRLLRVNLTAHAAANMLCNAANRDLMYEEWLSYVQPIKIVESELPASGHREVLQILNVEIRELLSPISDAWDALTDDPASTTHAHPTSPESTEGALDRWTAFLAGLQSRFPKANARTIIQILNGVATACLRDITMNGGKSFGSWWITKTWLDEMAMWLAEKGGFMEHVPADSPRDVADLSVVASSSAVRAASNRVSGAPTSDAPPSAFPTSHSDTTKHASQDTAVPTAPIPLRAIAAPQPLKPAPPPLSSTPKLDPQQQQHDDSGIGLRMSDEEDDPTSSHQVNHSLVDFSPSKFPDFDVPDSTHAPSSRRHDHSRSHVGASAGGMHLSSDPANGGDVIVC